MHSILHHLIDLSRVDMSDADEVPHASLAALLRELHRVHYPMPVHPMLPPTPPIATELIDLVTLEPQCAKEFASLVHTLTR